MLFTLNTKTQSCSLNHKQPYKVKEPYVNLYVKVADSCNANCAFCVYHNQDKNFKFDFKKFVTVIETIKAQTILRKVSFTGGEPTTNRPLLSDCLSFIADKSKESFVVVNTNGLFLKWLTERKEIGSISLSRHHFFDTLNRAITKTKSVASFNDIEAVDKSKIHLTCTLVKGFVDSRFTVATYLEYAARLGIKDVGFVSLMAVNSFAKTRRVIFDNINLTKYKHIVNNMEWNDGDKCRCKNFLYLPNRGKNVVKFYCRYRCKNNEPSVGSYVFDGKYLRDNFNGNIIY